jgi:hypothetical protein
MMQEIAGLCMKLQGRASAMIGIKPRGSIHAARCGPGDCPHSLASSQHHGGAHVLMSAGGFQYVTDSIEAGDDSAPVVGLGGTSANRAGSKSPYGLWGRWGPGLLTK